MTALSTFYPFCPATATTLTALAAARSKSCRDTRSNKSLDQTRAGTLICTDTASLASICYSFVGKDWSQAFTGSCARLKVVGLEKLPGAGARAQWPPEQVLPNAPSLVMLGNPLAEDGDVVNVSNALAFLGALPSLEVVDLSCTSLSQKCLNLSRECHRLQQLTRDGSQMLAHLAGGDGFGVCAETLAELCLDNSALCSGPAGG